MNLTAENISGFFQDKLSKLQKCSDRIRQKEVDEELINELDEHIKALLNSLSNIDTLCQQIKSLQTITSALRKANTQLNSGSNKPRGLQPPVEKWEQRLKTLQADNGRLIERIEKLSQENEDLMSKISSMNTKVRPQTEDYILEETALQLLQINNNQLENIVQQKNISYSTVEGKRLLPRGKIQQIKKDMQLETLAIEGDSAKGMVDHLRKLYENKVSREKEA